MCGVGSIGGGATQQPPVKQVSGGGAAPASDSHAGHGSGVAGTSGGGSHGSHATAGAGALGSSSGDIAAVLKQLVETLTRLTETLGTKGGGPSKDAPAKDVPPGGGCEAPGKLDHHRAQPAGARIRG